MPTFPGSDLIAPALGTVNFLYGGSVFLKGGGSERKARQPGMMLLISLAVTVTFTHGTHRRVVRDRGQRGIGQDVRLEDGRVLRVHDSAEQGARGDFTTIWHHGTPQTGRCSRRCGRWRRSDICGSSRMAG